MIADIAHELRTPLTVIQGDLQAILDGVYRPERERIGAVHEESLLLGRLIGDLSELSRLEAGELPLQKNSTDIAALIRKTCDQVQIPLTQKGIQLALQLDQREMETRAEVDPDRIEQVILNLLSNAIRYTPAGGQIKVALERGDAAQVLVKVSDTGPGIAPEDLPHLFERFWLTKIISGFTKPSQQFHTYSTGVR